MSWVFSLLSNSLRTGLFVTLCFGAVNQSPAQLTQDAYMTTGMTELDYSTISIVDTAKQAFAGSFYIIGNPTGVVASPDGLHLCLTSSFDNTAAVIDLTEHFRETIIAGLSFPFGAAVTPDGLHAYVTNMGGNTVSVIDTAKKAIVNTITVGIQPGGVAVTSDGLHVYVANMGSRTVSEIDTAKQVVVNSFNMLELPLGVTVTPDGRFVFVAIYNTGKVTVIDTAKQTVVKAIVVGEVPWQIAITPDSRQAYVTNVQGNTVSLIDTTSLSVVNTIPAGTSPTGIAITNDGRYAYVTNSAFAVLPGSMSVIDTTRQAVVKTIDVGYEPSAFGNFMGPNLITGTLGVDSEAALSDLGFGQFVDFRGGTLEAKAQLADAHTLVLISPGGTIETNHGFDSVFSGDVIGPGAFTKMGAGMLTFTGTNTYSGGTSINDGALAVKNGASLGIGPISFHGGTLEALALGGGVTFASAITLNGGGGVFLADTGTTSTLSGVISGGGALIKDGPGTLILTGANTYTGGTDINAGTVVVNSYSNLGTGPIRLRGGILRVQGISK